MIVKSLHLLIGRYATANVFCPIYTYWTEMRLTWDSLRTWFKLFTTNPLSDAIGSISQSTSSTLLLNVKHNYCLNIRIQSILLRKSPLSPCITTNTRLRHTRFPGFTETYALHEYLQSINRSNDITRWTIKLVQRRLLVLCSNVCLFVRTPGEKLTARDFWALSKPNGLKSYQSLHTRVVRWNGGS